ncbi:hypothetical protein Tco_0255007 [Tanacetum coccineum]
MSWFLRCSWCGGPFNGGNCRRCTNVSFGDEFVRNPDPISYDETPDFSYPPPQPQTYSCELCGNDSHYGYDCPPRVPLVYEQEPCYNQNFGDNYYPQNSPSFPQQYLCCENCGGPHANFQCQPRNQNFYEPNLCYNSNSSGFDQPPQYSIDHQPQSIQEDLNQQRMNDVHNEWINNDMIESRNELLKTMQSLGEMLREQVANLSTHTPEPSRRFNSICYDDDDDEESTIPLNEIISQLPPSIAITPVLPTMEPEDSLIMGIRILALFLKRNQTNNDDSLPKEDVPEENFKIYSNPLFEFNEEYISSDINPIFIRCDIDEIDADVSTDIKDGYHDLEGDIIYLKSLLINNTIPNLPPEVFLDHDPKSLNDEPNIEDLKIKENVRFTFEDRHYLSLIFVIKIFLPFLTYPVNSLLFLSSGSEDTIFDPGIFAYSFYSLEPVAYESSI